MTVLPRWGALLCLGLAMAFPLSPAVAGKFKVVHSFCSKPQCKDGANPGGSLTADVAGNLYGTTTEGGKGDGGHFGGIVYELVRQSGGKLKYKVIYRFKGGVGAPAGSLIADTESNLYGFAADGVFEISPGLSQHGHSWGLRRFFPFCSQSNCTDGKTPIGGLTYLGQASGESYDGSSPLFGVTNQGGANNAGVVFQLTDNSGKWTEAVLYSFCSQGGSTCTDGSGPDGALTLDQTGALFGTTATGGGNNDDNIAGGAGTIFKLSPTGGNQWAETVLHAFCSNTECADGAFPVDGLAFDAAGNLFGATAAGGHCKIDPAGCGTVFKLTPNGANSQETVLYTFCQERDCRDGYGPKSGVFIDASGNLFGTTTNGGGNDIDREGAGGGVVYKLSGSSISILHRFCAQQNCTDGEYPERGVLTSDGSGHLYATTPLGGGANAGVLYRVEF